MDWRWFIGGGVLAALAWAMARPWSPKGPGIFVQSLNGISVAEAEDLARTLGLRWIAVQALWQYDHKPSGTFNDADDRGLRQGYGSTAGAEAVIAAWRRMGIDVIPFAYPVPSGDPDEVVRVLRSYADDWGSPSVIIDPEAEWYGEPEAATRLGDAMSRNFRSWGFTSYGAPWYHGRFPWAQFAAANPRYWMPQTYDGKNNLGASYPAKSHDAYRAHGFTGQPVALFGTYNKTPAQFGALLANVLALGAPAWGAWKWSTTSAHEAQLWADAQAAAGRPLA